MASTNGYTQSIRQNLINNGVNNADIGYNPSTNYVTVKGQDAIRSGKNYNGTNFTTQHGFKSDWDNYQKGQTQPGGAGMGVANIVGENQQTNGTPYKAPTQSYGAGAGTQPYSPYQTNNPYDTQLNDTIKMLMNQVNNQQPVDLNAIYASPQYAAQQAQAQRHAQQGIRSAQESMGASGFGRSSALAERAQGVQNDANAYLETQVIPQLMAAEQQQRQQQLQNQLAMLGQLSSQQGVYDNRFNTANQYALNKGELLGNFRDPRADELIGRILAEKQNYGNATDQAGRTLANQNATNYRNELAALGYDPTQFGSNQTLAQAQSNMANVGQKTLEAKGQEFNQNVTMSQLTGILPDGTQTTAEQQRQLQNEWIVADQTGKITPGLAKLYGIPVGTPTRAAMEFAKQLAISQQNANTSATNVANDNARGWANINLSRDELKYRKEQDKKGGKNYNYESDPEFAKDVQWINANPDTALAEIKSKSAQIISQYGKDAYDDLVDYATPKKKSSTDLFTDLFSPEQ